MASVCMESLFSSVKQGNKKREDGDFAFLLWFIPIYSGIITDTMFLSPGILSLRSLDVPRHHEPYYCGTFFIYF